MKSVNKKSIKKITINVIVTFAEAAAAYWVATDFQTDKIAIAATVGAGVSAVWNIVIKPLLSKYMEGKEK